MKRIFEIEFPDDCGPLWMNKSNLLLCLTAMCRNTQFTVRDLTGDECDPRPESAGPIGYHEPSNLAIGVAARVWCDQDMSKVAMDGNAAMEIARIIDKTRCEQLDAILNNPNQPNVTVMPDGSCKEIVGCV